MGNTSSCLKKDSASFISYDDQSSSLSYRSTRTAKLKSSINVKNSMKLSSSSTKASDISLRDSGLSGGNRGEEDDAG
jgi:hypothetical protein